MNDLRREFAPIVSEAWEAIDHEATATLKLILAGRKVVDFEGPSGWHTSAIGLGRVEVLTGRPYHGVEAGLRQVQPLVEFRAPFQLGRNELDTIARGAKDADLAPVKEAAWAMAIAEDRAVFHGYPDARIEGICEAAADQALTISEDYEHYPGVVADALEKLRNAGVDGPYAIALGPKCYTGLTRTATAGGFPVIQHVQRLLDGPVIRAPAIDGAVVVSLRGGDFELTVGRDLSIGYLGHSATAVEFYLQESFTFRVLTPEAAVPLEYPSAQSV
ncbi:MAG: family 1 encapsulin nanocompartment shell protein [Methylohalobius sp. ZOD2]|uniref:family 1 encapsulin nanocompartment shell protein n=1 Tax=Methylohalobius crimeensis TaxID=244365 RepID=UPI0003B5707B|nr:family 1 encapsulin nanocompartment shell protein [Methylohalobius crimeensis]